MKNKNYTIVGTVPKSNRKIIETKGDGGYIPKDAYAWPLNFHGLVQAFNKMWQGYTSFMYPPTPLYVPTHPSLCTHPLLFMYQPTPLYVPTHPSLCTHPPLFV